MTVRSAPPLRPGRALAAVLLAAACATGQSAATSRSPAPETPAPGLIAAAAPAVRTPVPGQEDLAGAIAAIVDTGAFARAHWGIVVHDVASGDVRYVRNGDRLFIPASALKLVVAAAAAHHLGGFRYETTILAAGELSAGELRGDLVIRGTGDPTISGRGRSSRLEIFTAFADSLRAHGVRRVSGGVVADVSHWPHDPQHGDWEKYDLNWWYAAPTGPLGFNDNSVDFVVRPGVNAGDAARITWEPQTRAFTFSNRTRTGPAGGSHTLDFERVPGTDSIFAFGDIPLGAAPATESFAVRDPAYYAATVLAETLARAGIVTDAARARVVQTSPADARPLFTHRSAPLPQVLGPILQTSQNWYAEQLLKTLGREVGGEGSWRAGLEVERRFLGDVVGLDSTAFRLRDGSGLSSGNLITPAALARLVRYLVTSPQARPALDALAVSGAATGSLRNRLTDLPGRVRAKTGSVRNVATLAGLVRTADGRELAFSIMVNGTGLPASRVNAGIDAVVRALARSHAAADDGGARDDGAGGGGLSGGALSGGARGGDAPDGDAAGGGARGGDAPGDDAPDGDAPDGGAPDGGAPGGGARGGGARGGGAPGGGVTGGSAPDAAAWNRGRIAAEAGGNPASDHSGGSYQP